MNPLNVRAILFSLFALLFVFSATARAALPTYELSLNEAETKALSASSQLKSYQALSEAAGEQADSQFSTLLPRLTVGGTYTYITNVPTIALPIPGFAGGITFGSHNNYNFGPTLSYTLWDTGGARSNYNGQSLLSQAREEDRKGAALQLLLNVRAAYLRVQLALEELRLLNDSRDLARAQNRDIESNFRAGAATRLDRVDSQRDVINYELQFEQKQVELASDLKDLLAIMQQDPRIDVSHPGPRDVPGVATELRLDPLDQTLRESAAWTFSPPDDHHPILRGQELLAESSEKIAEGTKSGLYPTVTLSASALIEYPNEIIAEHIEQNTFGLSVSMPLFEGDRTRHLAAERRKEADSARFLKEQNRINLDRDYGKAVDELASLRAQQKLAASDVEKSQDAAHLYYQSYKGGKVNLTDVQSANNRALQSKVNAARIDALLLNQIFVLRSLSGEASQHGQ